MTLSVILTFMAPGWQAATADGRWFATGISIDGAMAALLQMIESSPGRPPAFTLVIG